MDIIIPLPSYELFNDAIDTHENHRKQHTTTMHTQKLLFLLLPNGISQLDRNDALLTNITQPSVTDDFLQW